MRLIDADELTRQAVKKLHITNSRKDITDLIDNAPTIEPSGDLISRADAIEAVCEDCSQTPCEYKNDCKWIESLKALPSADRPKGEWKWTHGGQCSECGFHNTNFDFNFCPNCGADMQLDK